MSDLSEDEALNILGYINVNGTVMTVEEFEKEIAIGQTTTTTNGATATVDATKKEISFIKKEQDVDEVVIFVPKSTADPKRNLSTAETLHYYLDSNAGVIPRRNSVGETVPTGSRARCSHHFKKIADGEASGMWPEGKYKCQSCSMIISP
jgi:hypothetical protein